MGEEIEKSVSEIRGLLKEFEEVSGQLGASGLTPEATEKLSARMDELQSAIEAKDGWCVQIRGGVSIWSVWLSIRGL